MSLQCSGNINFYSRVRGRRTEGRGNGSAGFISVTAFAASAAAAVKGPGGRDEQDRNGSCKNHTVQATEARRGGVFFSFTLETDRR